MALIGAVPTTDGFTDKLVVVEPAQMGVKHLLHFQGFHIAPPLAVDEQHPVVRLESIFVGFSEVHIAMSLTRGLVMRSNTGNSERLAWPDTRQPMCGAVVSATTRVR